MHEHPSSFGYSVSHTTRAPRVGETDGVSYHFVQPAAFHELLSRDSFLEHAVVHDTLYGTSKQSIQDVLSQDRVVTMDLDIVGAQNVRKNSDIFRSMVVWVCPPTFEVLEERLRARATDSEEKIAKRLANAKLEMDWKRAHKAFFDESLINDDFETCYTAFRDLVMFNCFRQFQDRLVSPPRGRSTPSEASVASSAGTSPNCGQQPVPTSAAEEIGVPIELPSGSSSARVSPNRA